MVCFPNSRLGNTNFVGWFGVSPILGMFSNFRLDIAMNEKIVVDFNIITNLFIIIIVDISFVKFSSSVSSLSFCYKSNKNTIFLLLQFPVTQHDKPLYIEFLYN